MAHSTRPQFVSAPNMAAFTRGEPTTALARRSALSSLRASRTAQVMRRLAPSPSPAMARASSWQSWRRAFRKTV